MEEGILRLRMPGGFREYTYLSASQLAADIELMTKHILTYKSDGGYKQIKGAHESYSTLESTLLSLKRWETLELEASNWPKLVAFVSAMNDRIGQASKFLLSKPALQDHIRERILPNLPDQQWRSLVKVSDTTDQASNFVYGEIGPKTFGDMLDEAAIGRTALFCDLGCGIGNLLVQAHLKTQCRLFGVEKETNRHESAVKNIAALTEECRIWALPPPCADVVHGDALSPETWAVVGEARLIVACNLVWTPEANQALWERMQCLASGAKIIVLAQFLAVHKRGKNGTTANQLHEGVPFKFRRFEYSKSGMSWTGTGGEWFMYERL